MFVCVMIFVLRFVLLWFSFPYILPLSKIRFGGERLLREGNLWIHCISLPLGTCLYPIEYLVLTHYMSSQSWYSCGFLFLLCLVDVPVLSNHVFSGSSLRKQAQDHKVSICITLMCMMISCWCTYCLQEGLMNMKVYFLYLHHLLWCI